MKLFLTGLGAGLFFLGSVIGQQADSEVEVDENPETLVDEVSEEPKGLVKDLANESYRVREAAQMKLWGLGELAVEALEEGVESQDPERAHRSKTLLRRIVTGIGLETRPEIVELVERYFSGGIERKRAAMERLRDERAFSQVLRLYRFEKDPAVRKECEDVVEQVVLPAVKMALVGDDLAAAESLLRLAPATDDNLRRRAALSRELGKLDVDLAETDDGGNDQWRLAILRAKGDVPEAIALAEKLGREDVVACLALFQGDPVPYFNWYSAQPRTVAIFRLNTELARDRWVGDERGALRIKKIMEERVEEGGEEEKSAMLSLLLNGYLDEAIEGWEQDDDYREFAFSYYESVELPNKAVEVYGYKGTEKEKLKWRSEMLEGLRGGWDDADEPLDALLSVSAFLANRGEKEEGYGMARKVGEVVSKQGGEEEFLKYLDLLRRMGGAQYELAFAVVADSLEDDAADEQIAKTLGALFSEVEPVRRHWNRLKGEKDMSNSDRLMFIGGLYGYLDLQGEKLDTYLARARADAEAAEGKDRREILSDLVGPAASRDDAKAVFELLEGLAKIDGFDQWSNSIGAYAGYLGEWERAAEAWADVLKESPYSYTALAKLASAYSQLGDDAKAAEYFDKVELIALDESGVLQALAEEAYVTGARGKEEEYLTQILMTSKPRSANWIAATATYANFKKREKSWRVAAAFSEIDILYDIRDRSTYSIPVFYLRKRFGADLMRGMALHEEGDEAGAMTLFDGCFSMLEGDGLLADDFFPLLREAGLRDEHDRYFEKAYGRIKDSIKAFPKAHNTYNSGAWLASRAARRLDEAHEMAETAVGMMPKQAAYLDTMAEVWFAMQNRDQAVEWSARACKDSYHAGHRPPRRGGAELREQFRRFEEDEFPVR